MSTPLPGLMNNINSQHIRLLPKKSKCFINVLLICDSFFQNRHWEAGCQTPILMCTINSQRFRLLPQYYDILLISKPIAILLIYLFFLYRHFVGSVVSTPIPGLMCTFNSQRIRLLPQKSKCLTNILLIFNSFFRTGTGKQDVKH